MSETIRQLTDPLISPGRRDSMLHRFVEEFGWHPSDFVKEYPGVEKIANAHLVVEHGLDNTAVVTFLKANTPFRSLAHENRHRLLSISYNNLVDWHFFPDVDGITTVYNRTSPARPQRVTVFDDADVWRAERFEQVTRDHPRPNLKSLDQALIETISLWKRKLVAELGGGISTDCIAALFNALIFIRALEDYRRFDHPNSDRLLLEQWDNLYEQHGTLRACIEASLTTLGTPSFPANVLDVSLLNIFNRLDVATVKELFQDFYDNKFAPYAYDFSLMSKHALSRIYEKYVALLKQPESAQLTFFADLPAEEESRALGEVYTPQYIARFFSRFLRDNLTPRNFREMRVLDPACGSGIFLRTILEMQCDQVHAHKTSDSSIEQAFAGVMGIDQDPNACHATRLSLALLHLVLIGEFPKSLNIQHADSLAYFRDDPDPTLTDAFDAVVANPPYIKWDSIDVESRARVTEFMGGLASGKIDMFLALLKLGTDAVADGGFLLYVLPHSFLIADNAARMRKELAKSFWIRYLVDLSDVPVFKGIGAYVVLLILEKKIDNGTAPVATVVRCREFVGQALSDALEGKLAETDFYEVYEASQERFYAKNWTLVPPVEAGLHDRIQPLSRLQEFVEIRAGLVSGADDVFIVNKDFVPTNERAVFPPFLSDREMERFNAPSIVNSRVFHPYIGQSKITEKILRSQFPKTYDYLKQHREKLETRSSVRKGTVQWWCPERPRQPENLLRPKIVSPHLIILPRFSLDASGDFAVSRCPLMYPKERGNELELLRYLLAVLNSPVSLFQISKLSHKYSRGYAMLEPKTLKQMAIPDPAKISSQTMNRIQRLVVKRLKEPDALEVELELEAIVADLYGLSESERELVGMEN